MQVEATIQAAIPVFCALRRGSVIDRPSESPAVSLEKSRQMLPGGF
jgi:hypothetical protein